MLRGSPLDLPPPPKPQPPKHNPHAKLRFAQRRSSSCCEERTLLPTPTPRTHSRAPFPPTGGPLPNPAAGAAVLLAAGRLVSRRRVCLRPTPLLINSSSHERLASPAPQPKTGGGREPPRGTLPACIRCCQRYVHRDERELDAVSTRCQAFLSVRSCPFLPMYDLLPPPPLGSPSYHAAPSQPARKLPPSSAPRH